MKTTTALVLHKSDDGKFAVSLVKLSAIRETIVKAVVLNSFDNESDRAVYVHQVVSIGHYKVSELPDVPAPPVEQK